MPWGRTKWKDHYTEFTNVFTITDLGNGRYSIVPVEGEIIQQGTSQNADHFNNIEDGIQENQSLAQLMYTFLMLKVGHSEHTLETLEEAMLAAISELQTKVTDGMITAAKAATLTATLGLALGGTGATTAAAARTNLEVPSAKEFLASTILHNAEHSIRQATDRDINERLIVVEAQLAQA